MKDYDLPDSSLNEFLKLAERSGQKISVGMSSKGDGDMGDLPRRMREAHLINRKKFFREHAIPEKHVRMPKISNTAELCFTIHESPRTVFGVGGGGLSGLLTNDKDLFLATTSKNSPTLLGFDPMQGIVFNARFGLVGLKKDLPGRIIELMERHGSYPDDIVVWIGPTLDSECFKLASIGPINHGNQGRSVRAWFEKFLPATAREIDLSFDPREVIKNGFLKKGVLAENIIVSQLCTACVDRISSTRIVLIAKH